MTSDGILSLGFKKIHCDFSETAHYVTFESQSPFTLESSLSLLVSKKTSQIGTEFIIEGLTLCWGG